MASRDMFLPVTQRRPRAGRRARHAAALSLDCTDLPDERRPLRRLPARAAARGSSRPPSSRRSSARRSGSGLVCRRCTGRCCSTSRPAIWTVGPVAEHLRVCVSGGAPMPVEVMRRFESTFGVRILEGYGLSETSPVVSSTSCSGRASRAPSASRFSASTSAASTTKGGPCRPGNAGRSSSAART